MNHRFLARPPLLSRGLSIVEFMITMTLGALIIAAASSVYLSNKKTNRVQEGLARLQENARFATYQLNYDLRMAGYQGCLNTNTITITNRIKNPSSVTLFDTPIDGFDASGSSFSPALPSNLSGKTLAGSDVLEIRRASSTTIQMKADMTMPNNPVLVYDRKGINAGDVVMISNCSVGDIFIAGANTNGTAITHTSADNTGNDLTVAYTAGTQVMQFLYYAYYIKNTGRTNADNQPVLALVRQDVDGIEEEIAEGVEQMRILYGVDTNADKAVDTTQTATQVQAGNNWNNVISVRINLLFATVENVNDAAQPYVFNGATITPTDRKLRREWTIFVTLRNRGLPS